MRFLASVWSDVRVILEIPKSCNLILCEGVFLKFVGACKFWL
jgi:hypothetical protein